MKKLIGTLLNIGSVFNSKASIKIAYRLFSTPLKGQLQGELPDFLQRASLQTIIFDKLCIQCYIWDITKKPIHTIVLIHGWQSNSSRWEALVNYLPNNYRIIAIDAMGQGKSQGKELSVYQYSQLISQVLQQYNPSAVISHSLGSFALLEALSTIVNPALKKVVIMGCLDNFKDIVDNYYQMMGYSSSFQKDFTAYLENIIGRDITQYAGHIFAEDLSLDTLIIHDKEDEIIPLASCKALHDILQQNKAKLIYTKNLDHSLQDPKVYQSIKDFIVVS